LVLVIWFFFFAIFYVAGSGIYGIVPCVTHFSVLNFFEQKQILFEIEERNCCKVFSDKNFRIFSSCRQPYDTTHNFINQTMDDRTQNIQLQYLDQLFPYFPELRVFTIGEIIPEDFDFPTDIFFNEIFLEYAIRDISAEFGYTIKLNVDNDYRSLQLTDKGREAKAAGGHFAYIKKLADEEQKEQERQHRADEISRYDLLQKKYFYKSRYLPHIFSTLALLGTVFSIFIAYKALHKSDQPLTPKTTDATQLKPRNDTLLKADTALKKASK
jgi:hypothetical protein